MSVATLARVALARTGVGSALGRLPLVEAAYVRHAAARRDHSALQWGIFETYDAAAAAIPGNRMAGWDHDEAATIWRDKIDSVRASTYPVLFWLTQLMRADSRVTDVGGSIGLTYYAYRRFAEPPRNLRWLIVEVPHIVAEGRRIASREGADSLVFDTAIHSAGEYDILLAAGALQYMPRSLPGLLEDSPSRPRYILLNKVPLTRTKAFWTLHNFGPAVTPYHVFNETAFLEYFEGHGYAIRDRWDVPDISCDIPFHPERTVESLTGFCLERSGS